MRLRNHGLRLAAATAAAIIGSVVVGGPALAAPHAHNVAAAGSCSVSGSVVSGQGLPTDQVINFMVTDASGTRGWVLGFTDTGTWNVDVPAASGPTTYQFVSKTWGANGSKYDVFAGCTN